MTSFFRRAALVACVLLLPIFLVAGAGLGNVPSALATTGPSANHPPTYKVNNKFAAQFTGEYTLQSMPAAARIQSAAIGIEVDDNGNLYGIMQFYGYDAAGFQTSWVESLYHFHQTAKTQMTIDLLTTSLTVVVGRMVVAPPSRGSMSGKLTLSGHTYPVVFHKVSNA